MDPQFVYAPSSCIPESFTQLLSVTLIPKGWDQFIGHSSFGLSQRINRYIPIGILRGRVLKVLPGDGRAGFVQPDAASSHARLGMEFGVRKLKKIYSAFPRAAGFLLHIDRFLCPCWQLSLFSRMGLWSRRVETEEIGKLGLRIILQSSFFYSHCSADRFEFRAMKSISIHTFDKTHVPNPLLFMIFRCFTGQPVYLNALHIYILFKMCHVSKVCWIVLWWQAQCVAMAQLKKQFPSFALPEGRGMYFRAAPAPLARFLPIFWFPQMIECFFA